MQQEIAIHTLLMFKVLDKLKETNQHQIPLEYILKYINIYNIILREYVHSKLSVLPVGVCSQKHFHTFFLI